MKQLAHRSLELDLADEVRTARARLIKMYSIILLFALLSVAGLANAISIGVDHAVHFDGNSVIAAAIMLVLGWLISTPQDRVRNNYLKALRLSHQFILFNWLQPKAQTEFLEVLKAFVQND